MTSTEETTGDEPRPGDHGAGPPADAAAAVERARGPRADLRAAMLALEKAAAAPAPNRLGDWAMRVHDALVDLGAAYERHIAVTEGPEGLLEDIQHAAPRLSTKAARLTEEHHDLRARITEMVDLARGAAGRTETGAADEVRRAATDLMAAISRHRQAGSDLVFEAFEVDIGAGD